ncbi:hypothetical protein CLOM_g13975 [Closterium sp. NIES-68]|nr:hypothetical protein CLOM_g13975 [Closterium sp. NIES-68]
MPPAAPPRPASPAAATAVASVTPHRVALALLLRLLAGPPPPAVPALPDHPHAHDARAQAPLPRRVRQRLALFLLREAKAAHSWHEPPLSALLLRLAADVAAGEGGAEEGKGEGEGASGGVGRQLVRQLQALQSPDDLFSLAASLRSCVGGSSGPSSQQAGVPVAAGSALGLFLRSLLLALHHLPFQGVCHVLGAIHGYLHQWAGRRGMQAHSREMGSEAAEGDSEWREEGEEVWRDGGEAMEVDWEGDSHCMLASPGASSRPLSFDTITHRSRGPQGSAQRQQARRVGGRAAAEGAAWLSGGRVGGAEEGEGRAAWEEEFEREVLGGGGRGQREGDDAVQADGRDGGVWGGGGGRRSSGGMVGVEAEAGEEGRESEEGRGGGGGTQKRYLREAGRLAEYLDARMEAATRLGAAAASPRTSEGGHAGAMGGALPDDVSAMAYAHDLPPKVHLWQHHESLSSRHLSSSLASLHRYFDYSAGVTAVGSRPASEWWAGRFQAGLLVEGAMHARYGHTQHAMGALIETVHMAQQETDDVCLVHALSAICHLLSQTASSDARRQLAALGAPSSLQQPTRLEGGVWRGGGREGGKKAVVGGGYGVHGRMDGEGEGEGEEEGEGEGEGAVGAVQQQVCALLQRCLLRGAQLRLPRLVFAIHLLLARYSVEHVSGVRPLHGTTSLSLPPSDVTPSPLLVCHHLRMGAHLFNHSCTSAILLPSALSPLSFPPSAPLSLAALRLASSSSSSAVAAAAAALSLTSSLALSAPLSSASTAAGLFSSAQTMPTPQAAASAAPAAAAAAAAGRLAPPPAAVVRLAGAAHGVRAAAWEVYGCPSMAMASSALHLLCYSDAATADDLAAAAVKLLRHTAAHRGASVALPLLHRLQQHPLLSSSPTLRIAELEITHDLCLATGRTSRALLVCQQLATIATRHGPSPAGGGAGGTEVDLELEAACRHVHTLIAATCFPQAAAAAKALFTACCRHNRQLYHVRCLLLMALLHLRAGSPLSALPHALTCASLASHLHLLHLAAAATLTAAEATLALAPTGGGSAGGSGGGSSSGGGESSSGQHAAHALSLLDGVCLPVLLGQSGLTMRCRTLMFIAQCQLSIHSDAVHACVPRVLPLLEEAAHGFHTMQELSLEGEASYLLAMLHHVAEQPARRDAAARRFLHTTHALAAAASSHSPLEMLP